jgi:hypothetical protein
MLILPEGGFAASYYWSADSLDGLLAFGATKV